MKLIEILTPEEANALLIKKHSPIDVCKEAKDLTILELRELAYIFLYFKRLITATGENLMIYALKEIISRAEQKGLGIL